MTYSLQCQTVFFFIMAMYHFYGRKINEKRVSYAGKEVIESNIKFCPRGVLPL